MQSIDLVERKFASLAFIYLGLSWGANFIFMKIASEALLPVQIAFWRIVFALPLVLIYALARRMLRWDHLRNAHHFVVMSLLAMAIYYWAFAQGTALLPSSIAGLLSGTIPLSALICNWLFLRNERPNRIQIAGITLGLLGILLVSRPWSTSTTLDPAGVGYMCFGSLCLGSSFVYARRFITPLKIPAAALTVYQMALAALFLLPLAGFGSGLPEIFDDRRIWSSLIIGLGIGGTGIAYIAYYYIIGSFGAVVASSATYIPPIVALFIGVVLIGEPIDWLAGAAAASILLGIMTLQIEARLSQSR